MGNTPSTQPSTQMATQPPTQMATQPPAQMPTQNIVVATQMPAQMATQPPTQKECSCSNIDQNASANFDFRSITEKGDSRTSMGFRGMSGVFMIKKDYGSCTYTYSGNISIALIPLPIFEKDPSGNVKNIIRGDPIFITNKDKIVKNGELNINNFDWMCYIVCGQKESFGNVEETSKKYHHNYSLYLILVLILVLIIAYINRDKLQKLVNL